MLGKFEHQVEYIVFGFKNDSIIVSVLSITWLLTSRTATEKPKVNLNNKNNKNRFMPGSNCLKESL